MQFKFNHVSCDLINDRMYWVLNYKLNNKNKRRYILSCLHGQNFVHVALPTIPTKQDIVITIHDIFFPYRISNHGLQIALKRIQKQNRKANKMARKITQDIANVFNNKQSKTIGNTYCDSDSVYLHNNRIIYRDRCGTHWVSLAGWSTPTTRERINGIANFVRIHQHRGEQIISGFQNGKQAFEIENDSCWVNTETGLIFDTIEEVIEFTSK